MPRTWILLVCLLAVFPGQAVMVDPSGRGQVLLFPWYSVNDGQQTLISVVNHDSTGKALKVRFREALNGRVTASLNLYLGEFDVWTAVLLAGEPDSEARLVASDNSCTVPDIRFSSTLPQLGDGQRYLPFSASAFTGGRSDGGPESVMRTREGYVEIIEMGTLIPGGPSNTRATPIAGMPPGCRALNAAWGNGGYWRANADYDLLPPSGKLSGAAHMINVAQGTLYSVNATALSRFSVVVQHTGPAMLTPDLASAVTEIGHTWVESTVVSEGRVLRSYWPPEQAIDAVSAALMQVSIHSEFSIEPQIGAQSDWVISMPTRRHYADPELVGDAAIAPFTSYNPLAARPRGCEYVRTQVYNRDGGRPIGQLDFGNYPAALPCLCGSAQRLRVSTQEASGPSPYGCVNHPLSAYATNRLVFTAGYFDMQLRYRYSRPAIGGEQYSGLPVIGYMVRSLRNGSRVYTVANPHSGEVACKIGELPCPSL